MTHQGPATSLRRVGPSRYPRSTRRESTGIASASNFVRAGNRVLDPHASNRAHAMSYIITKTPCKAQRSQEQRFDAPAFVAQRARDGGRCHERAAQRRRRFERSQRLRGSGGCMRRGRNRRRPAWGRTQAPTRGPRARRRDDQALPLCGAARSAPLAGVRLVRGPHPNHCPLTRITCKPELRKREREKGEIVLWPT